MLGSVAAELLYDETSTSRAAGILSQMETVPILVKQLQEEPKKLTDSFEEIRKAGELYLHYTRVVGIDHEYSSSTLWCSILRERERARYQEPSKSVGQILWKPGKA